MPDDNSISEPKKFNWFSSFDGDEGNWKNVSNRLILSKSRVKRVPLVEQNDWINAKCARSWFPFGKRTKASNSQWRLGLGANSGAKPSRHCVVLKVLSVWCQTHLILIKFNAINQPSIRVQVLWMTLPLSKLSRVDNKYSSTFVCCACDCVWN